MPVQHPPGSLAASGLAVTLLLTGAIAGFFYAYSSSVMPGLDAIGPVEAIAAMQGINEAVRNPAFALSFFGTPVAGAATAAILLLRRRRAAAAVTALATATYVLGAMLPTAAVNVPMNQALAVVAVPADPAAAAALWADWSARWTWWNGLRTMASLISLLLVGLALFLSARDPARVS